MENLTYKKIKLESPFSFFAYSQVAANFCHAHLSEMPLLLHQLENLAFGAC